MAPLTATAQAQHSVHSGEYTQPDFQHIAIIPRQLTLSAKAGLHIKSWRITSPDAVCILKCVNPLPPGVR